MVLTQQDHLPFWNVLLNKLTNAVYRSENGDGQDAAVHHIEKKPNLLNTVKLKLKQRSKTKGSAETEFEFLDLVHMLRNPYTYLPNGELKCECSDYTELIYVLKCDLRFKKFVWFIIRVLKYMMYIVGLFCG